MFDPPRRCTWQAVAAENVVGPIEAAPPSIRDLRIEGDCIQGEEIVASYTYIGGRSVPYEATLSPFWNIASCEGGGGEW